MEYEKIRHLIAIVVWYNPTQQQVAAIDYYQSDVERVIVVDNSKEDHSDLCAGHTNYEYISLGCNRGIARALNIGCQRAMDLGADWVLTMDQDSLWNTTSVHDYVLEAEQYGEWDKVGVFFPMHDVGIHYREKQFDRFSLSPRAMTSGNLLRLDAWKQVGEFLEDLFIDSVDDEIDCRLVENGWQIVRVKAAVMSHRLGEGAHFLRFIKHPYTAHQPFRYYYIARNMRRMIQLHPSQTAYYRRHLRRELKRLCLYDWTDKKAKLSEYLRGWRDGRQKYPTEFRLTLSPQGEEYKLWLQHVPSCFFIEGTVIHDKRNQIRVFVLPNGEQMNVKRYRRPGVLSRIIYSTIRKPKAQRAYENAQYLLQHGIPTPEPIGYILCGKRWLNESYLITRQVPYSHRFYEFRNHGVEGYEDVIKSFTQLCARMHKQGVLHKDLSPGNILWDKGEDGHVHMCVVDINRLSIGTSLSMRICCRNFCRLWGHMDFMRQLSRAYASERNWDAAKVEQWIIRYWKRFWHVSTEAEIDYLFRPLPID